MRVMPSGGSNSAAGCSPNAISVTSVVLNWPGMGSDQRRSRAQDQPGLDIEPEVDVEREVADTRDMVRGAPRDVFDTDVSPARCRGAVADLTRITLHLAARPFAGD